MAARGVRALDLTERWRFGELVAESVRLCARHGIVFLSVSLLVVAPVSVLVDGVWAGQLRRGLEVEYSTAPWVTSYVLWLFAIPPMVTAMHVRIVQRLGEGIRPSVGRAIREAAGRIPAATVTVVLYTLAFLAGLALLILPGIWIGVRCYFGAQAAVVDGVGPVEALHRSVAAVGDQWWRAFGFLFGSLILLWSVSAWVLTPLALLAERAAGTVAGLAVLTLAQAVAVSLNALFGTLLFFDLRTRTGIPAADEAMRDS